MRLEYEEKSKSQKENLICAIKAHRDNDLMVIVDHQQYMENDIFVGFYTEPDQDVNEQGSLLIINVRIFDIYNLLRFFHEKDQSLIIDWVIEYLECE